MQNRVRAYCIALLSDAACFTENGTRPTNFCHRLLADNAVWKDIVIVIGIRFIIKINDNDNFINDELSD